MRIADEKTSTPQAVGGGACGGKALLVIATGMIILAGVGIGLGLGLGLASSKKSGTFVLSPNTTAAQFRSVLNSCSDPCNVKLLPGHFLFAESQPITGQGLGGDAAVFSVIRNTGAKFNQLTITGAGVDLDNGTHIYLGDWFGGFQFDGKGSNSNSKLVLANLTVDTTRPFYTLVVATSVSANSFVGTCHESTMQGYCRVPFSNETWANTYDAITEWDWANNRMAVNGFDHFSTTLGTDLVWSSNGSQLTLPVGSVDGVVLNRYYVVSHARTRMPLFRLEQWGQVEASSIRVFGTRGFAFLAASNYNVTFTNLQIVRRNGYRMMNAAADAFHMAQNRGHIVVRNCEAERMGDDGVNVNGYWRSISSISGDRMSAITVRKPPSLFDEWSPIIAAGEPVEIYNRSNLQLLFSTTLTKIPSSPGVYNFTNALPLSVRKWDVIRRPLINPKTVLIENCYFHDFRGRALRVKGQNVIVRNNRVSYSSGAAIYMVIDLAFDYEDGETKDVHIFNNTFDYNCRSRGAAYVFDTDIAPIYIVTDLTASFDVEGTPVLGWGTPLRSGFQFFKNITIESNTIYSDNPALYHAFVSATDGVKFINNVFHHTLAPTTPATFYYLSNVNAPAGSGNTCYVNGVLDTCSLQNVLT